ncbi:hypothetical protein D3837_03280 [Streptococcus mutans]|nr:hypothetical protein [Streptococcus mutans]
MLLLVFFKKSGYLKERGTNCFIGYPISEYLSDYQKRVPNYDTAKQSDFRAEVAFFHFTKYTHLIFSINHRIVP